VRELGISEAPVPERPFGILVRKTGGRSAALAVLRELASQMGIEFQPGLDGYTPDQALAAVALVRAGMSPDAVGSTLTWREFEGFCADVLKACGYDVRANIVVTKPRRQIDILAESRTLALSVDCKHWGKAFSGSTLERVASDQIERTRVLAAKRHMRVPVLPMVLTLLDSPVRAAAGVPIVPIFTLRDFLASVSRFDSDFAFV
jgi:hypothetical protein